MSFLERLDNICVIDTKMFDFEHYNAAYLVQGKEIVLIDTGMPNQLEAVRAGIKGHGFSISDISNIFITHCHPDHIGNVAPLLKESPKANVYIHPAGLEYLLNPSIQTAKIKAMIPREKDVDRGEIEPVPQSRIKYFNDGDMFDLGNSERLRVIFTPGHQPSGLVLLEENNRGLFINDLVGNYFVDAGAHYTLNPIDSNHIQAIASLEKLIDIPVKYLYLGHYGIVEKPKQIIAQAIKNVQQLVDIGTEYIKEGKPESISDKVYEVILPELEKLRKARGEALYQYATQTHLAYQVKVFTQWCQENLNNG